MSIREYGNAFKMMLFSPEPRTEIDPAVQSILEYNYRVSAEQVPGMSEARYIIGPVMPVRQAVPCDGQDAVPADRRCRHTLDDNNWPHYEIVPGQWEQSFGWRATAES